MKRRNVGGVGATWFVQLCIFGCFLMAMVGERPADGLIFFYFLYGLQTIAALRAARGSDLIETVLRLATVGLVGVTMAFYFSWGSSPDPVRGGISLAGCVITVLLSLLPVRAAKAP